ncbi:hypothetical protein PIB30_072587, partial [Stylosanthes scabra]|nr:hypothetical protein [Stylosanthes scabra]
ITKCLPSCFTDGRAGIVAGRQPADALCLADIVEVLLDLNSGMKKDRGSCGCCCCCYCSKFAVFYFDFKDNSAATMDLKTISSSGFFIGGYGKIQVLFNDQVSNDFNTLIKNLPQQRNYYATAVPGSFCGRLFPKQTLHLVHSSAALCWLSKVPNEITDSDSSAHNKGRIHYTDAPKQVADAYATQYRKDMGNFLHAGAQEVVENGLMLLQFPVSNVVLDSDVDPAKVFELIGNCLVDMVKVGVVSEEKVDSFNVPLIYPPVKDVKGILEGCDECFSIEGMEILQFKNMVSLPTVQIFVSWFRAALQGMIEKHFGAEIVDEHFERFAEKVKEFPDIMDTDKLKLDVLFVLLRRKTKSKPKVMSMFNGHINSF